MAIRFEDKKSTAASPKAVPKPAREQSVPEAEDASDSPTPELPFAKPRKAEGKSKRGLRQKP